MLDANTHEGVVHKECMVPARRLVAASLILVLLVSAADLSSAQTEEPEWAADLFETLEAVVIEYNTARERGEIGFGERFVVGHQVALVVTDEDDAQAAYGFYLDAQGFITGLEPGEHPEATLRVLMSKATAETIGAADDPLAAFREGVRDGRIQIQGVGPANSIVVGAVVFAIRQPVLAAGSAIVVTAIVLYGTAKACAQVIGTSAGGIPSWIAWLKTRIDAAVDTVWSAIGRIDPQRAVEALERLKEIEGTSSWAIDRIVLVYLIMRRRLADARQWLGEKLTTARDATTDLIARFQ